MWPFKKREIPFCKDCKYLKSDMVGLEYAVCGASVKDVNPVTGKDDFWQCATSRLYSPCGKYGKLFEKKAG